MRYQLILFFCFLIPSLIFAQEKKVALIIGNSNYQNGAPLANPENDAEDIGIKLKAAGFDVSLHTNLSQTEMRKVIDEFGVSLDKADVGLFFYAGHGVQAKGKNYLIPIDAALKTENDVEYNCVDAGRILAKMEDASTSTNIVILDACRNNPFERSWSRNSNGNGLAYMDAPGGSLIAYSTAPGKTASDGYYRNSPFTSGLLEYMGTPNLNIEALFKLVRVKVMNNTNGKQVPWESTSLTGDFYFNADQDKTQTKLADILPDYKESSIEPSDYESQRQQLAAGIRSIAVMPILNYTGNEDQDYVANGLHVALTEELGKLFGPSMRIISNTSTKHYADFKKNLREIASELNVDGIVEASLLGAGEKLKIYLKLYSAFPEEELIWSNSYDSDISEIFNLYNRITKNIADEIQLSLTPEQEENLKEYRRVDKEAYDLFLKGYMHLGDGSEKSNREALEFLTRAIEIEPGWATLYSSLAQVWMGLQQMGHESPRVAVPKIYEYANKALELDPNSGEAHHLIAMLAYLLEWDWSKAEIAFSEAITLMPSNALARLFYSQLLFLLQEKEEAIKQARIAIKLDPINPIVKCTFAASLLCGYHFEEALSVIEEVLAVSPEHTLANNILEKAAFQTGDYEKVVKVAKYHIPLKEEAFIEAEKIFEEQGFISAYSELLRQVEVEMLNDFIIQPTTLACKYYMVKQYDKAMDWIEKAYEIHSPNLAYMVTGFYDFEHLYDNPRFISIVDKLKLPQPKDRDIK